MRWPGDEDHRGRTALRWMMGFHLVVAIGATFQRLMGGLQIANFHIFRNSFEHLIRGQDLYAVYPAEGVDLYKYSPTFALLFGPFAMLPVPVGLLLWNLVNAAGVCLMVRAVLPPRAAAWVLAIALLEALGAIQNVQSNGVVTALIIAAFVAAERESWPSGAIAIATGTAIKIFPIAAGLFGLLYGRRWRHVGWCVAAGLLLLLAPLLVTSGPTFLAQYRSWAVVEAADHLTPQMMWLGGWLEALTNRTLPHLPFQVVGVVCMLLTAAIAARHWDDGAIRRLLLGALLVFVTLFNHQSESPTYVIGFVGVGIWWAVLPRERWRDVLVLLVVLLGSVAGTDLTPGTWRRVYYHHYQLKAIMTTLAWMAIQWDFWRVVRARGMSSGGSPMTEAPFAPAR